VAAMRTNVWGPLVALLRSGRGGGAPGEGKYVVGPGCTSSGAELTGAATPNNTTVIGGGPGCR